MARLISREREVPGPGDASAGHSGDLSVIARDMRIEGNVDTKGSVRIDGKVTGSVRAGRVDLSDSGSIEGDLDASGEGGGDQVFTISGDVRGAVRVRRVEIGEGGSVLGGLEVLSATVSGHVEGGMRVRDRLLLKASAVVEGDIDARRLALEEGGRVNGNIRVGDRAALDEGGPAPTLVEEPEGEDARASA